MDDDEIDYGRRGVGGCMLYHDYCTNAPKARMLGGLAKWIKDPARSTAELAEIRYEADSLNAIHESDGLDEWYGIINTVRRIISDAVDDKWRNRDPDLRVHWSD